MRNFQDKRGSKNFWQSKPFAFLLGVLVVVFAWNVFGLWGKMSETSKNKQISIEKLTELQQQKEKLSTDIEKLSTDQGVEGEIRNKFGLVKPGEGVIVIVDDKSGKSTTNKQAEGGFFSFFKNWFK